jgi:3-methyladenine DNA glycosylase AlkD
LIGDARLLNTYYTFDIVMNLLISRGSIKTRKAAMRRGAGENQFGVGLTIIRDLAKRIGKNHELGMDLWFTNNSDAMILASSIMDYNELTRDMIQEMIFMINYYGLIDEFVYNVVAKTIYANDLAQEWINSKEDLIGRAGWDIMIYKIVNQMLMPKTFDELLTIIKSEMMEAPLRKRDAMNRCLCEIGIHLPEYTKLCIRIGEQLGRFDIKPFPGRSTSTYAPDWIAAGIKKREKR